MSSKWKSYTFQVWFCVVRSKPVTTSFLFTPYAKLNEDLHFTSLQKFYKGLILSRISPFLMLDYCPESRGKKKKSNFEHLDSNFVIQPLIRTIKNIVNFLLWNRCHCFASDHTVKWDDQNVFRNFLSPLLLTKVKYMSWVMFQDVSLT